MNSDRLPLYVEDEFPSCISLLAGAELIDTISAVIKAIRLLREDVEKLNAFIEKIELLRTESDD